MRITALRLFFFARGNRRYSSQATKLGLIVTKYTPPGYRRGFLDTCLGFAAAF